MFTPEIISRYPQLANIEMPPEAEELFVQLLQSWEDMHSDILFVVDQVNTLVDTIGIKMPEEKLNWLKRQQFNMDLMRAIPNALKKFMPSEESDEESAMEMFNWTRIKGLLEKYKTSTKTVDAETEAPKQLNA